ncbi:diguanylate cyclase [Myxococcota bacterium]
MARKPKDDLGTTQISALAAQADGSLRKVTVLMVMSGPRIGEVYCLREGEMRIGRADNADVQIRDESISRLHASISMDEMMVCRIRDLKSTNGLFVNGQRVVGEVALSIGDHIKLGETTVLKFEQHGEVTGDFHSHMSEASTQDPLTGVYNRRYFEHHFAGDFRLGIRHQEKLSLLFVDIDHFKRINDTYGHAAGDEVLRRVARELRNRIRHEDVLARYGGEEFVMVMRRTDAKGAASVAEAIREKIEKARFEYQGKEIKVTISIGVATLSNSTPDLDGQELLEAADKAMYRAKESGRNRVVATTL